MLRNKGQLRAIQHKTEYSSPDRDISTQEEQVKYELRDSMIDQFACIVYWLCFAFFIVVYYIVYS